MKINKKAMIFIMTIFIFVSAISLTNVTAANNQGYNTTIIDSDGLEIEVANVKVARNRSGNATDIEQYIKDNVNESYAKNEKLEARDVMLVKNIIVDGSSLPEPKTIETLWNGAQESFIMMNDAYVVLYDVDENSPYYVAYVNTMQNDSEAIVTDSFFAYTNTLGEAIEDAIYDYNTGLAYVPKKYTEENKNGLGYDNVQVELLQNVSSFDPSTTFNVIVEKDEDIDGNFATSGTATVKSIATEFGIKVALDKDTIEQINGNYFRVYVNNEEIEDYKYYNKQGILVVNKLPSTIQDLKISISKSNINEKAKKVQLDENFGISTYASFDDIGSYGSAGEWELSDIPQVGSVVKITKDYANMWYDAWDHGSGNGYVVDIPICSTGTGSTSWVNLAKAILNGAPIDDSNLQEDHTWIQWNIDLYGETIVNDDRGVTYKIPQASWLLKCVHSNIELGDGVWRQVDPDGNPRWHATEMWVRIYKVTDKYLLVGMLTPSANTQAGAGLYKIAFTTGNGNLDIGKKDSYGDFVAGAKLAISGPDGFYQEVVTGNQSTLLQDVKKGIYTISEIDAPNNMIKNYGTVQVEVQSNQTAQAFITNNYQRGSVSLTKYDIDHRGATLGDAKIEGATYKLCAAADLYEGTHLIYSKDQVVKENIVTKADGTTDAVTDLPIGNYYYVETSPSEGFNLNTDSIPVSVIYAGQDSAVATTGTCEGPEKPIYGNIEITKRLGALDYDPEINLKGAQFKATLVKDRNQVYYSNVSGNDGICRFDNIPYGEYIIEESIVPNEAEKIANFNVRIIEEGKTYQYTKVDNSKDMKIEVQKEILVHAGESTDAKVSGAVFTVYRDANCLDKVCDIGPTDASGYAISGTMRTGTYYLKETTFPEGIDPDATIPGEAVTYRNKVYTVTYDNKTQGTEQVTVSLTVKNEPKRNDIEIIKDIGATTNTPQFPLDKCEFTATLKSTIGTANVFSRKCTAETDASGYCIIKDLPYGEYVVEETKVSPLSLKCADFEIFVKEDRKIKTVPYKPVDGTFLETTTGGNYYDENYEWLDGEGHIVDIPKVMQIKMRKVDANRTTEAPDYTQGDATLEGAIYEIYRYDPQTDDYTEKVYNITVNHKDSEGYWCAESGDLLVGKYMVKEKIKYSETVDGVTYNYSYARGYLTDPETYYFEQQPDLQTVERTYQYDTSKEEVLRGSVQVIKYDNNLSESDEVASKGAILRLTLDSNKNIYYDVTIDEYGYGEFVDKNDAMHSTSVKTCYGEKYYPYTIPYGQYTITEVKESDKEEHTSFFIQPEPVTIERQVQKEYRIEADEPVEMYLKIQKRDKDTGAKVTLEGARFKVWNVEKAEWVSQITYPSGIYIDEFESNAEGMVTLPHKLEAGDYVIYETQAPEGYYLEEAYRIPEKESDIGKVGGKKVTINKAAMGVDEDTPYNKTDLYYIVDMEDEPLKVKLEIVKKGEMLTEVLTSSTEYGEKYTPVYKLQGLPGVTYEITAAEDIKSPDGKETYVSKGTKVDTITTGEDGIATTVELYPGEYEIKETVTPEGYLVDENIPNVVLENKDTLKRVETTTKELTDIRQKLGLTFKKIFEEVKYANGDNIEQEAVFGIFAKEAIKNYNGKVVIPSNKLVALAEVDENGDVTSPIDLPEGKYYVEELYASYPYTISDKKVDFTLEYNNNHKQEFVVVEGEKFTNNYDSASITLVKLATTTVNDIIVNGDEIDTSTLDEEVKEIIDAIKGMTEEEIKEYFAENEVKFVTGAKYGIYTDEECTNALRIKNEETGIFEAAELVTNDTGLIKLENVPVGEYYVKEIEAPKGYELSEKVVKVVLDNTNKNTMIYQALIEDDVVEAFITKTDIFTGDVVPNCTFEIKDMDGKVLLHSITNEDGKAFIPLSILENEKTYTYTEIEAPDIYDLNTEPHEFTVKFDEEGNWITEPIEVENIRKTREVIVRKVDAETGDPLEGCVFTIALIDPTTGEQIINAKTGEPVYLVENATTNENGEFVIEKAPMGTYRFTEIKAPEGYELDEDLTGLEFTIDNNSPETIIFEVTNTGDIAVIVLSVIAIASIFGIAYIVLKNKKAKLQ